MRAAMRTAAVVLWALVAACSTGARVPSADEVVAINQVLDDWHAAAAAADETRYFSHLAPGAIFLGTDSSERWDVASFRAFAHPYFAQGKGWTFVPEQRHVYLSDAGDAAWFDERLSSQTYGDTRGSGALRRIEGKWKIAHYNLAIPIPNSLAKKFVEMIRAETK
jgi:ketosteroid isomerase-like protein